MKLPPKPTAVLLEHQPFFKGVPWRPLERLAEVAAYAHFDADTTIFSEGGEADRFFLLLEGCVALRGTDAQLHPTTVQVIEAGEALGWSWAFPPNRWSHSAVTLGPVEVLAFDARRLRMLCDEDPALSDLVYRRIAHVLLQRLTATRRRLLAMEHAAAGIPIRCTVTVPAPGA